MSKARMVIISGPSGAGKTTIVRRLLEICPLPLTLSVSATTRPPRPSERQGVDYWFLTAEDFHERRRRGDFLECFEVFGQNHGHWYGTMKETVATSLQQGKWVVLEIDVQGMQAIVQQFPDALSFFVRPASLDELERRLRGRGTESDATIRRRLEVARREWEFKDRYRYDLVNDKIDATASEICRLICSEDDPPR
jgi:guanylate kinase